MLLPNRFLKDNLPTDDAAVILKLFEKKIRV